MHKARCILIGEDDPQDIELVKASLAELNLPNEVVALRDGVEVLDFLHKRGTFENRVHSDPLIVLLDIKMPRKDGIQVLKEMKANDKLKRIPVIMFTSSRQSRDLMECYDLGVNAYVVKPVQFDLFITAIKELGEFWISVNEPPP